MADSEAGQHLDEEHSDASGTDDGDLCPAEDRLTDWSIQEGLPVISGGHYGFLLGGFRRQDLETGADDDGACLIGTVAVAEPKDPRDGVLGQHQSPDRLPGEVQQGRIAPLVGGKVGTGEADERGAAVVVHGEVDELLVPGATDHVGDEFTRQEAVPASPPYGVDPITGEDDVSDE